MDIHQIIDRTTLAAYFRQDIPLHLYSLGDLDDFYWPRTTYFGIQTKKTIDKVTLLYRGEGLPVLLALSKPGLLDEVYLTQLMSLLPVEFYAHLSPGLEKLFSDFYTIKEYGDHLKMALVEPVRLQYVNTENTFLLTKENLPEIKTLYEQSYPDNAFDPQMLNTGQYIGYQDQDQLLSIAGVHVYSSIYRVAALGNVATHPNFRNQGLGKAVTAKLCQVLMNRVDFIGLNVKADNQSALSLYESLGFQITNKYGEFSLKKRH